MTENSGLNRAPMLAAVISLTLLGAGGGYLYNQSRLSAKETGASSASRTADAAVSAAGMSDADRKATEAIVRAYILENPEILTEAAQELQRRETTAKLASAGNALARPFAGAIAGNPNGDVTLVEFTDYSCGFCRVSVEHVNKLLASDKQLRVVYREVPILSPASTEAAKWALAAAKQGKHRAFHDAMFSGDKPSETSIRAAARAAGLDMARAQKDAESQEVADEIRSNQAMMQQVGFGGTPAFIVGNQLIEGAQGYEALKNAIAKARKAG